MQRTKIMTGIGLTMLFLMGMAGTVGASGASYCNISNVTIAAMCANLTSAQSSINAINIANTTTSNRISVIVANQVNDEAYINTLSNDIVTLSANQVALSSELNNNATTISGLSAAISSINSNATSAEEMATSANSNATAAKITALKAYNLSTTNIDTINNINSSFNQRTGILNTNLSTASRVLGPIANLNLTGTYAKTQSDASNAGWEGGLALILVIVLIIIQVATLILGRNKKGKEINPVPPIMGAESRAKADKSAQDKANVASMAILQSQKEDAETQAKMDKFKADPSYKTLLAKLNKDKLQAKKLGIEVSALPSYKAFQEKALTFGISIDAKKQGS